MTATRVWSRSSGLCAGLICLAACGDSNTVTSPSPTPAPSPPPAALNLSGIWSGTLGQPQSVSALRMTWAAIGAGTAFIGEATLVKPSVNIPVTGRLAGMLNGTQLSLTFLITPSGTPPPSPGRVCVAVGEGVATATTNSISGSLSVSFTSECNESGLGDPGSNQLTLSR